MYVYIIKINGIKEEYGDRLEEGGDACIV